jgi:hypothetical protein
MWHVIIHSVDGTDFKKCGKSLPGWDFFDGTDKFRGAVIYGILSTPRGQSIITNTGFSFGIAEVKSPGMPMNSHSANPKIYPIIP